MVLRLFVATAGDIVFEDAALTLLQIVPRKDRHHHQPLHRQGQVRPHHLGQAVGLPLQAQVHPLDLLVMGQLRLEQADHFDAGARRTGDGHRRVLVRGVDFLDPPRGHLIPLGGLAIPGDHHPRLILQGHYRGAHRDPRHPLAALASRGAELGQEPRLPFPYQIEEAGSRSMPIEKEVHESHASIQTNPGNWAIGQFDNWGTEGGAAPQLPNAQLPICRSTRPAFP